MVDALKPDTVPLVAFMVDELNVVTVPLATLSGLMFKVARRFDFEIDMFVGDVPGLVTMGIISAELSVVVDGKADILVSAKHI